MLTHNKSTGRTEPNLARVTGFRTITVTVLQTPIHNVDRYVLLTLARSDLI
jgi:hypothetical protein